MSEKKRMRLGISGLIVVLLMVLSACAPRARQPAALPTEGAAVTPLDVVERAPLAPQAGYDFVEESAAPSYNADVASQAAGGPANQVVIERLIIRTGSISVTVEDTRVARDAVEAMVSEMAAQGAFIVSTNEYGGAPGASPYVNMTIRVPATRFDEAMDRLAAMAVAGTTPSVSTSGQDVTEEYVDLQARLESLEAARDRLLHIMDNAQSTEELLQAEAQLTQREAEIESLKGRMQYLEQSAALSSISIELIPYVLAQPVDTRWRPAETVREAVEALLQSLRSVGDFLIFFGIFCLPWLLVIVPVGYVIFRAVRGLIRRRRAHKAAAAGSES